MKFTSEDLMKAMGLAVGDRIKVKTYDNFEEVFETYEVMQKAGDTYLQSIDCGFIDSFAYLIDQDFEILPRPKRVGDLKCEELDCRNCPIRVICLEDRHISNSLYFNLELYNNDQCINFDQEIYDILKKRLDKEVK